MVDSSDGKGKAPLLEAMHVGFSYGDHEVLADIQLAIREGDFIGIIGPNGAGKSTLIRILAGFLKPSRGAVRLNGRAMASLSKKAIARNLAVVAQVEPTDFGFSVEEEVMLGRAPHHAGLYFETQADRRIVERAMSETGVRSLAERQLTEISGGERQRVRISRALAQQPRVLLLDEPTTHLDLHAQLTLAELARGINRSGLAVVMVSHDINFVVRCCKSVIMLHEGGFRFRGSPHEVITEQNIAEVFHIRTLVDQNPLTGLPRMSPIERIASERSGPAT